MIQTILTVNPLPIPKSYSENLKELLDMLLQKEADQRPSINEILDLKIVRDKFEEYNLYENADYVNNPSLNESSSQSKFVQNSITNSSSASTLNTLSNPSLSKIASEDRFEYKQQIKDNKNNQLHIEVEVDYGNINKKITESTSSKKKNTSNKYLHDSNNKQNPNMMIPQVKLLLLCL